MIKKDQVGLKLDSEAVLQATEANLVILKEY